MPMSLFIIQYLAAQSTEEPSALALAEPLSKFVPKQYLTLAYAHTYNPSVKGDPTPHPTLD